ncbi:MAG: H-NS family nucleoid-associated regulatory protein [Hyphomicrobiaceae bacterium]
MALSAKTVRLLKSIRLEERQDAIQFLRDLKKWENDEIAGKIATYEEEVRKLKERLGLSEAMLTGRKAVKSPSHPIVYIDPENQGNRWAAVGQRPKWLSDKFGKYGPIPDAYLTDQGRKILKSRERRQAGLATRH